jgi:hypothetical protein
MAENYIPQNEPHRPSFYSWFTDKTVLVTGATSGIGEEIVKQLSFCRTKLLLCGRNKEAMDLLEVEIKGSTCQVAESFLLNFSSNESLKELIAQIQKTYEIDILVNNAGIGHLSDFSVMSEDQIHTMVNLNIVAIVQLCRAFIPQLQKGNGILNVGSVASFFPTPGSALYGATKRFLLSFTDALHWEMLSSGVHVTGVYPGNTHSRFLERSTGGKVKKWQKAMSPVVVAERALAGLSKNKMRVIPGYMNKLKTLAPVILPNTILLNKLYKNAHNHSKEH